MLNRRCPHCNEKIKGSYNFCPNCGAKLREERDEWGMLGKEDRIEEELPTMFPGMSSNFINKIFGSTLKMIESELNKSMNNQNPPMPKVKLMINGKEVTPSTTKRREPKSNAKTLPINFSKDNLEKWKKLKKVEPKSELRRINNKIEYNLEVPGVKSIKDISIVKLENSLEIKAIGKNVGYKKNIQINLPLRKFTLLRGNLILEMDTE